MNTAWDILLENSTLQVGTAWEHLNNQLGDGQVVYIDRLNTIYGENVVTLMADYEILIENEDLDVTVEPDYVVTLEDEFKVRP